MFDERSIQPRAVFKELVFQIHLGKYVRNEEFYFTCPPHNFHFCRFWADKLVNSDYTEFGMSFTGDLAELHLTSTERYILIAIAILWQGEGT